LGGAPVNASESVICYCKSLTLGMLEESFKECGNLGALQKRTRAGTVCGGCRVILESVFGESPDEILSLRGDPEKDSGMLIKPGSRIMKGFVVADHRLDSVVSACNGVPPQFGNQRTTVPVEYALLDQDGRMVLHRKTVFRTHETFRFDTAKEDIPRPLYGMFLYSLGRSNYGASRFNVAWTNGVSSASTHEINDSGRPNVFLPLVADPDFLAGPNRVYLAVQNPRPHAAKLRFRLLDRRGGAVSESILDLGPHSTRWLDVNRDYYAPGLALRPDGVVLKIEADGLRAEIAPTIYFFFHNLNTDIWSANHL
jgi:hypothetical protein